MRGALRLPRHRATTAQLCAVYPFHAEKGLGPRGVYLGTDVHSGGAFCFDPFELYRQGELTATNMLLLGDLGSGKSAAAKCFVARSVGVLGRWVAIIDPKGEYGPLAERYGLTVLKLRPGGSCRLNPLDDAPAGDPSVEEDTGVRRAALVTALLSSAARRELGADEETFLRYAIEELDGRRDTPTLGDLAALLSAPTEGMANKAGTNVVDLAKRLDPVKYAAARLLEGHLRGMFDGPTTVSIDRRGRGVVLDVSSVFHDRDALTMVMIAATGWLTALFASPPPDPHTRRLQVIDECWALLGDLQVARYFQACWKLSRAYGVSNIAIAHRIADLRAQSDDGTAAAKVAEGLLADTQTRVLFRQPSDQVEEARSRLELTTTEAEWLPRFGRGRALWRVRDRAAIVQHVIAPEELAVCDTDARLVA